MKIQVLVAAMNQHDCSLPTKMKLKTEALIGNQCDKVSTEQYEINGNKWIYFNRSDRGVGLNRNTILLHSGNGIITFADEDMVFVDGYEQIIKEAFNVLPEADAIVFNIETIGNSMGRRQNNKIKRLHFFNALNYGAARVSARANSIRRENITFHTCFGGGAIYSCGEDTLFIVDMLKHGLKIYTYPKCIAKVDQSNSTWFKGYNKKYLHDKGALFAAVSSKFSWLLCLQDIVRHPYLYKSNDLKIWDAYRLMKNGIQSFKELKPYN